uniref:Dus domain-containing protein n=1 Tax=Panagrellus redivivus TaxID=6233 RepID=A0A7E4UVS4_PANRE
MLIHGSNCWYCGDRIIASLTGNVTCADNKNELAFRELMRAHGADLAFSPMIKADQFVSDPAYREKSLGTWKGERHKPFIIQFVGTNPETFLIACRYVEGYCDGVDIDLSYSEEIAQMENLCLQNKRDRYVSIVSKVFKKCLLPISVKMRCEETTADTIEYAKLLEEAGASMITVHGRTQEMTGVSTGIADWSHIAAVKSELHIPVIANGNIQLPGDVERCIQATGCDAVMSAEGILYNPYLFENTFKPNVQVAREYVSYAKMFSATMSAVTEHIFRICQYSPPYKADYPKITTITWIDGHAVLQFANGTYSKWTPCGQYVTDTEFSLLEIPSRDIVDVSSNVDPANCKQMKIKGTLLTPTVLSIFQRFSAARYTINCPTTTEITYKELFASLNGAKEVIISNSIPGSLAEAFDSISITNLMRLEVTDSVPKAQSIFEFTKHQDPEFSMVVSIPGKEDGSAFHCDVNTHFSHIRKSKQTIELKTTYESMLFFPNHAKFALGNNDSDESSGGSSECASPPLCA